MGMVEGYSADLYCDVNGCSSESEASGETKAEVRRVVKKRGWRSLDRHRYIICPSCNEKGYLPEDIEDSIRASEKEGLII